MKCLLLFVFRYVGEAEAKLKSIFKLAAQQAPSILLMDDVDLLCPHRTHVGSSSMNSAHGSTEEQKRFVSCLLTLVDGVNGQNDGIFLIGKNSIVSCLLNHTSNVMFA